MYEALKARKILEFDCVIPIQLSPDKRKAGEIDRTGLIAAELARLLESRIVRALELTRPISKHPLRTGLGLSPKGFETEYSKALEITADISKCERIVLVDDVCTEGSTLRCAAQALRLQNSECQSLASTAGQMILKCVVANDKSIALC
jgi:predicted amidophosphoribosyltransferase